MRARPDPARCGTRFERRNSRDRLLPHSSRAARRSSSRVELTTIVARTLIGYRMRRGWAGGRASPCCSLGTSPSPVCTLPHDRRPHARRCRWLRCRRERLASARAERVRMAAFGLPALVAWTGDDTELAARLAAVGVEAGMALFAGPIVEGCVGRISPSWRAAAPARHRQAPLRSPRTLCRFSKAPDEAAFSSRWNEGHAAWLGAGHATACRNPGSWPAAA